MSLHVPENLTTKLMAVQIRQILTDFPKKYCNNLSEVLKAKYYLSFIRNLTIFSEVKESLENWLSLMKLTS